MRIQADDPTTSDVAALLREHLETMALHSPPESIHALDIEALCGSRIAFWTAREGADLLGCGALLELDPQHGEIKSMHTAEAHRRSGVGAAILEHIISEAQRRSYARLSLETGSMAAFAPARALYARFGFVVCAPFGNYQHDPNSTFMTLALLAP